MPDSTVVEVNISPNNAKVVSFLLLAQAAAVTARLAGLLGYWAKSNLTVENKDDSERNVTLKVRSMDPLPIYLL